MKTLKKAIIILLEVAILILWFCSCETNMGFDSGGNGESDEPGGIFLESANGKPSIGLEYKMTVVGASVEPVIDNDHLDSIASGNYVGAPVYRPDELYHGNCSHVMWGYENGHAVKTADGTYHLLIVEFCDGHWGYSRIGYWTSLDKGDNWERIGTAIEGDDFYDDGRKAKETAWAPTWFWDEKEETWNVFYRGNYRVWRYKSAVPGKDGIAGPYEFVNLMDTSGGKRHYWDDGVVHGFGNVFIAADGKYHASYSMYASGAYESVNWVAGLMRANNLSGPWERVQTRNRPVFTYAENPLVYSDVNSRGEKLYFCVYDDLSDLHSIGFGYSEDGVNWTTQQVDLSGYVEWAPQDGLMDTIRTPCSLIKEDDGTYTVIFTARDLRLNWYYSVGKITAKIDEIASEPEGNVIFPDGVQLWNVTNGKFYDEYEEYSGNDDKNGSANSIYTGQTYEDVTVDAILRCVDRESDYRSAITNRNSKAGIYLRKPDIDSTGGYYVYLYAGGRIEVYAGDKLLAQHDTEKNAFMFRKLRAEIAGDRIKIYFDEDKAPCIDISDDTYGEAGYIGAEAVKSHWHYRKISIYRP